MKKRLFHPFHKSVFVRLILLFLFLMLPLMIICFISIAIGNQELKKNSLLSFEESLGNVASALDSQFKQIYNQSANICTLSKTERLSNFPELMEDYERISAVNSVMENLTAIKENNMLIENIQIYIPAINRILNANGYKHGSMQELDNSTYLALIRQKNPGQLFSGDRNQLSYLITSSYSSPRNLVQVTFFSTSIKNYLSMFLTMDNEYLMLKTEDGSTLIGSVFPPDDLMLYLDSISSGDVIFYNDIPYQIFEKEMPFSGLQLLCIANTTSIYYSASKTTLLSALILTIMLICILIYFIVTWNLIRQPMNKLIEAFHEMEQGNLNTKIAADGNTDFSTLYMGFNHMTNHINQLIEHDYKQKLLLQKAELKQLQAQINPHFLYNSFFLLQRLIKCELQQEASSLSKKLGIYFQYVTKSSNEIVFLKDEYQHAKIYTDIQAIRFEKRIQIHCETLPEKYAYWRIPKIILQPILENAFNYGLADKTEDGILSLYFITEDPKYLKIVIEDNGENLNDEQLLVLQSSLDKVSLSEYSIETTGLLNIYRRLQIYSHGKDSMDIVRSESGGLKIIITLEETVCTDY